MCLFFSRHWFFTIPHENNVFYIAVITISYGMLRDVCSFFWDILFLIADCISGVLSQYHFAWQGLRAWFLRFTVIWKLIRITELGSSFVLAHFWLVFPFCTPLKIPENLWFSAVFREYKMGTLARNELSNIESSFCIIYRTKKIYRIFYFMLRK